MQNLIFILKFISRSGQYEYWFRIQAHSEPKLTVRMSAIAGGAHVVTVVVVSGGVAAVFPGRPLLVAAAVP